MNIIARDATLDCAKITRYEPLGIVGMACRFPHDANTVEKYWDLLSEGRSIVGPIPERRWHSYRSSSPKIESALNSATRLGSFLSDVEGFDADFFGISALEAECIDPQQRIVLELSWEAFESAGIAPSSLKRQDVGVYVAANSFDFAHRMMANLTDIKPWTVNGGMLFGIANRVSYALDFRGPSMTVDTACAGSLTALHLACQSLWFGEIPLAVVGGVNVMCNPGMTIALDAAGATAPDGKSKAFDKTADGYGRGEGAGIVILKRLSEALDAGDRILATVIGTGVFQDGRTAGMMAPNPEAQEAMLRSTYERFGIEPRSISYVEAHGTGTQAGDKAEVRALARVFGEGREAEKPCLIGSAKPNIGHLEAGAGMAGLIKTVLAMQHGVLPPSIHAELNPDIEWDRSGLKVVDGSMEWPLSGSARRAGISCFGVGGTISHAILEEAPTASPDVESASDGADVETLRVFPLSARSNGALRDGAARLAEWMRAHPDVGLNAIGRTLACRRDHLPKRAVAIGTNRDEVISALSKLAANEPDRFVTVDQEEAGVEARTVWVFSGHGAQRPEMAKDLLDNEPAFAEAIDGMTRIFEEELGYSARQAIIDSDWSSIERIQASTFAIQIGLANVWRAWGFEPAAVIGHSVGEIAASVVAGALDLEEAARFACRRARIYQRLAGRGAMAMARVSFEDAQKKLGDDARVVAAIAASQVATVISGEVEAVDAVIAKWKRAHIPVRKVASDAAFHSPQIDALIEDIRAAAAKLTPRAASVTLYTTAYSDPRSQILRGADYWVDNSREAVLFTSAVEAAIDDGYTLFLEVSSAPIVAPSIREIADIKQRDNIAVLSTLTPSQSDSISMATTLANLFCRGLAVDWTSMFPSGEFVDLPKMAWQHRPYWLEPVVASHKRGGSHAPESHTLLGEPEHVRSAQPLTIWRTHLDFASRPYPGEHPLFGVEIVPAAALLHSLMKAGGRNGALARLKDIGLHTPVPVETPLDIQIVLQSDALRISSRLADEGRSEDSHSWITHTVAQLDNEAAELGRYAEDIEALWRRCDDSWSWARVEELYRRRGIGGYGFPWRMSALSRRRAELVGAFDTLEISAKEKRSWAEVLDAALTVCPLLLPDDEALRMPSRIDRVAVVGDPPENYLVHAVCVDADEAESEERRLEVHILDLDGTVRGFMRGLVFGVLDSKASLRSRPSDLVFCEAWRPAEAPRETVPLPQQALFVGSQSEWLTSVIDVFSSAGVVCERIDPSNPAALSPRYSGLVVVVGAAAGPEERVEDACERNAWTLVDTAQRLLARASSGNSIRLCCITQDVRANTSEASLAQSSLWGVARIIAGERPDLWGGVFDLGSDALSSGRGAQLLEAISWRTREDVVSITGAGVSVLRLVPAEQCAEDRGVATLPTPPAMTCRADAAYLVTGGLGALGLEAAELLIDQGARKLILVGRRGLPERPSWASERDATTKAVIKRIEEMEASGASVTVLQADISDEDSFRSKLSEAANVADIRGVVHAAGVFEGGMLGQIDRAALRAVMRPKVLGTMVLHRRFPVGALDFFVHFSSSGQLARLSGQSCYAAANSFLDGFARYRNSLGAPDSLSLGWMAWGGVGMSKSIDATMIEARAQGLDAIDSASALNAWRYCHELPVSYTAIFAPSDTMDRSDPLPILREVAAQAQEDGFDGDAHGAPEIPSENRLDWLTGDVRKLVAAQLRLSEEDTEVKRSLIEMGVDSLITVSLRVRLRQRYKFEFPPTLLWNNPSIYAIAQFIDRNLEEHV